MDVKENYKWEAEMADGTIITEGGDLTGCVRFSLIPVDSKLPRHDICGVKMVRRFARAFQKVKFNDHKPLPGLCTWIDGSNIVMCSEEIDGILTAGHCIKKRYTAEQWWVVLHVEGKNILLLEPYLDPFKEDPVTHEMRDGRKEDIETQYFIPGPNSEYVHVVVFNDSRVYVRSTDGTVLITPADFELYL